MRIRWKAVAGVMVAAVVLTCASSPAVAQIALFYDDGALRLQVTPANAEVFVDGYYIGTVDDFDGVFQRLHLRAGEHDIEFYLSGYRSVRQKILLQPRETFRVRYMMEELKPGDTPDARPVAPPAPPPPAPAPAGVRRPEPAQAGRGADFGSIAIRVQPRDAVVLIDGQRWDAPADNDRLVVQLPTGEHRVEITKDGFGNYSSTIDIRRGDETALNVSLTRE